MHIHWHNIVALFLALAVVVLALRHRTEMATVLASVAGIGPGHTTEEKTLGLVTLAVCGAVLVAIVRLLTSHRDK